MTDIEHWTNDIHTGDAAGTLAELPESSVHMVMTSPPYFGLRDYGVDGQIGLEESLDEYISELVGVFREVRRVLRPDGSAWLNLGDSYATARSDHTGGDRVGGAPGEDYATRSEGALGRKNKMLVPHRVAIALQEDGWIVRNDVTWVKPNPMPSSVKDRLNTTTEQVFMLAPNPDYWFDLDSIREEYKQYDVADNQVDRSEEIKGKGELADDTCRELRGREEKKKEMYHPAGKNPGDVFEVTTKPFPEAHFAVYPPELVETPLKATCPPKVCAECGSPYDRDVERERVKRNEPRGTERSEDADMAQSVDRSPVTNGSKYWERLKNRKTEFKGWTPTCDCDTDATEAGIALDPFAGAGTTALVAKRYGRRFIGIDLNEEYVAMAQKRLGLTVDNPEHVRDDADAGLEDFA